MKKLLNWRWWVLNVCRYYIRLVPIQRGKTRLLKTIQPLLHKESPFQVKTRFDTKFSLNFPDDYGWESLFTLGTYETGTSVLVQQVVKPGDVVVDIGANLGWYTVLCAYLVQPGGHVHAFEPVPWILEKLQKNVDLNGVRDSTILNAIALGAEEGMTELYTFEGRSHGETSTHPLTGLAIRSSSTVKVLTLDTYLQSQGVSRVDLIKLDAEGAEKDIIHGTTHLLSSRTDLPMVLMEINFETAHDWSPHELLTYLQKTYGYTFLRIKRAWDHVIKVRDLEECENGDNVLCYVPSIHSDRLASVKIRSL